jgi:HPt (histidine-containing phosphotransfer) domain-containing protein
MMGEATFDRATFDALKETTGAEFVMELVDTFLQEAPAMLQDLRDALIAQDAGKFRRVAHSLKSNSNTFGALALGTKARELEMASLSNVPPNGEQLLAALEAEYSRAAAALNELRHA